MGTTMWPWHIGDVAYYILDVWIDGIFCKTHVVKCEITCIGEQAFEIKTGDGYSTISPGCLMTFEEAVAMRLQGRGK